MNRSGTDANNVADRTGYAAIYARVSGEDQGKGFSRATQIDAGRKLAAREGYTVLEFHLLVDEASLARRGISPGGKRSVPS